MRWIVLIAAAMFVSGTRAGGTLRVRLATYNIQRLSGQKLAEVDAEGRGTNAQLCKAAEIIQRVRPDILLINEIDFDADKRQNVRLFAQRYLGQSQNGQSPIEYAHVFFEPVNTGLPSGHDLDNDGRADGPGDALGYGHYPGEYGMALLSRYPIDRAGARTFQKFLWKDMPHNLLPDGSAGKPAWYSPDEAALLRLSSKSHWDVPVRVGGLTLHVLAAHPTPPVFDGDEDRNGRRNYDEIRFWADYISGPPRADYIYDDAGKRGGLPAGTLFVIMGDLNADPVKAERPYGKPAIAWLLEHPLIRDPRPRSRGAFESAGDYPGDGATRTSRFGRLDYVLPCKLLKVADSGVFWPQHGDPLERLVSGRDRASDHYLVWVDVEIPTSSGR